MKKNAIKRRRVCELASPQRSFFRDKSREKVKYLVSRLFTKGDENFNKKTNKNGVSLGRPFHRFAKIGNSRYSHAMVTPVKIEVQLRHALLFTRALFFKRVRFSFQVNQCFKNRSSQSVNQPITFRPCLTSPFPSELTRQI